MGENKTPEDHIFDDEMMNEMLLNPDSYGLEEEEEKMNDIEEEK